MAGVGITPAVVIAAPSACTPRAELALDPVARLARVAADDEPQRRAGAAGVARMARTSAAPSRATVS